MKDFKSNAKTHILSRIDDLNTVAMETGLTQIMVTQYLDGKQLHCVADNPLLGLRLWSYCSELGVPCFYSNNELLINFFSYEY